MGIKSAVSRAISAVRNIGPSIQGNNYGTGSGSSSSGSVIQVGGPVFKPGEEGYKGGGGGGGAGSNVPTIDVQAYLREQQQAIATAEKLRKDTAKAEIEKNARNKINEVSRGYQSDLRNIKDVQDRRNRINEYNRDIQNIRDDAGREKVKEGVITAYQSPSDKYARGQLDRLERLETGSGGVTGLTIDGTEMTKDSAQTYRDIIEGRGDKVSDAEIKKLEGAGLISVDRPKEISKGGYSKDYKLPVYESKFDQPTKSTRTDLQVRDIMPEKADILGKIGGIKIGSSKVNVVYQKTNILGGKVGETKTTIVEETKPVTVGGVASKSYLTVKKVLDTKVGETTSPQIYQQSTIMDKRSDMAMTTPEFEKKDISIGGVVGTPVAIAKEVGYFAGEGVEAIATGISKIPGDIKTMDDTTLKGNIVESLRVFGKPVAKIAPELLLFGAAPIATSASGFAEASGRGATSEAGAYALFGGLFAGAKVYKAGKAITFEKKFRVVEEPAITLNPLKDGKGTIKISDKEVIIRTQEELNILKEFAGKGSSASATTGRRVVLESSIQKYFGLKPSYTGKATGEIIETGGIFGKVIKVSKKQAQKDYKKALEFAQNKFGFTKSQAQRYVRRIAPKTEAYLADFSGIARQGGKVSDVAFAGTRRELPLKLPQVVESDGLKILSSTKGGKVKEIKVIEGLEETGTKVTKGAEAGELGEITYYKGIAGEFNPLGKLGKRTRQFEQKAAAKKVGEKPLEGDFGKVEQYRTAEASKEITYRKSPKRVSTSLSDIEVKIPEPTKRITIDEALGIKTVEVKPKVITKDIQAQAKEFTQVSEELLPYRTGASDFIVPGKIQKTPLSKTFGEPITKSVSPKIDTKPIVEKVSGLISPKIKPPRPSPTPIVILEEAGLPTMVGGRGLKTVPYAGAQQYEVTEMSAVSMPGVTQPVYLEGGTQPKVDYLSATDLKTDIKSDIKIKTDLRLGGAIIQEPITRIQPKEKIKEKIKERTMIKTQIKPKTRLELLEKVISKTTQINKPRFPEPRPPEPKITIKPILSISPKSTVVKQAEKIMDSFSIFVTKQDKKFR